ncbi:YciI family protein [Altericroceibacterium endophyticum]|uniref:YciI family protein n=1 Tax=Altericroceibacterium endophyticum TaxID=1808508 RepID=A0A6I4T480_9SPHN|nr:YciI family protein [Altericroceibacterium endophyticum]MXO64770.1 YciI family protein [Altericroceibacterium endophyticum]
MKYALLIHEDHAAYQSENDLHAVMEQHARLVESLGDTLLAAEGLRDQSTTTTLRRDGDTVDFHDGPFAEAREQLGGIYIIEVESLDEAMDVARQIPMISKGAVEIRPCESEG